MTQASFNGFEKKIVRNLLIILALSDATLLKDTHLGML
jgi:hypothetical protein